MTVLDRLLDVTPEPVLLAVLHRRVRELLELGDRLGSGERLAAAARAMGINSEFVADNRSRQAKLWTTDELTAAIHGLVELDAMVKGAPGAGQDEAQRRLAFSLWVMDHAGARRRSRPSAEPSVGRGPGLFLDHEIALDGEDAAAFTKVEELDQVRIDVQLRAVLAQAAGDAEAQPLAPIRQPERRVEPGRDEPAAAGGASISNGGHARNVRSAPHAARHDPLVLRHPRTTS